MLVKHRGKWALQTGKSGQRRRFSTGFPATPEYRAAAERAAGEIKRSLSAPLGNNIGAIVDAYLHDAEKERKIVDPERLRNAWKALKPHFASSVPADVTRPACRLYTEKRRRKDIKDGTIIKELGTLKSALNWHDKNTPSVFEFPPTPEPRDRWLTREEFKRLLEAAQGVSHLEMFLHLAIATAGRKAALLELKWKLVNFKRNQIFLGYKPSGKKRATVPMTKTLKDILQKASDENTSDHLVEYNGRGICDIKKAFNAAVKRADLEDITIHDLRHTAAVWMAGENVPMSKISQYLGHSSTAITERIYARYQPDHLADAASALEV